MFCQRKLSAESAAGEFSRHQPRDDGSHDPGATYPTGFFLRLKRVRSLVRMRLALASDDRNGFIADDVDEESRQ